MGDEENKDAISAPSSSWRGPRPGSVAFSLLLHSALTFMLLWFSASQAFVEPSLYEQMIQPHEDHIVWYPLKEIPSISPEESGEARAEKLSQDTLIHQAPNATADNRLVWRTPDRTEPEKKTPAPDMIAVERGADARITPAPPADSPPPASRPTPKTFVAPAAPPPAQVVARITLAEPPPPEIPKLAIPDGGLVAVADSKVKVTRRFVPPTPVKEQAKGDTGTGVALPDAPALPGSGGSSDINALIVNSVHLGGIEVAPPRQSAISTGPDLGAASRSGGKGGIQIPGVTVAPGGGERQSQESTLRTPRDPFKGTPEAATAPSVFVLPRIAPLERTLSAPLPPSSRNVPKLIEARFGGRIVYTMLVPMKGLPGYAGDWTIWFAERSPSGATGTPAPMRAPLPVRKPAESDPALTVAPGEVQLAARITIAGKIESVFVIGPAGSSAEAAVKDLESWQFLPALRNREPVEVDLVISIPFGISAKPAPRLVPVLTDVDRSKVPQHN